MRWFEREKNSNSEATSSDHKITMIASRTALTVARHTQARILSTQTTTAVDQLRSAFEDYRKVQ